MVVLVSQVAEVGNLAVAEASGQVADEGADFAVVATVPENLDVD